MVLITLNNNTISKNSYLNEIKILDSHSHITSPAGLKEYQQWLVTTEGKEGRGEPVFLDEDIIKVMTTPLTGGLRHINGLDVAGISLQLISPRPNQMIHGQKPGEVVILRGYWGLIGCQKTNLKKIFSKNAVKFL